MRAHSLFIAALLPACLAVGPDEFDEADEGAADVPGSVASFEPTSCTTEVVRELSLQLAHEMNCLAPGSLVDVSARGYVQLVNGSTIGFLSAPATAAVEAAVLWRNEQISITSAFRSFAAQYLVYRWYERGRCDIPAAAQPGTGNHEQGAAIDVANWDTWRPALLASGWQHNVPGDEVHFEYLPRAMQTNLGVLAFQRLWNRNNPHDVIEEDGLVGPIVLRRLARAPAKGFALGPTCR